MKRVLITGSNRGIGLEFTRQYLESGWRVYATCRRPVEAQSLHMLAELHSQLSIHRLDVTKQEDLNGICQELKGIALDLLINNAGIYFRKGGRDSVAFTTTTGAAPWRSIFSVRFGSPRPLSTISAKATADGWL